MSAARSAFPHVDDVADDVATLPPPEPIVERPGVVGFSVVVAGVLVVLLGAGAGCTSMDHPVIDPGVGAGGSPATGAGGAAVAGTGGVTTTGTGGATGPATSDDSLCGGVALGATRTIAAGQTLTICAGSTLTAAASDVGLLVRGTLLIQGTAQSPVKLVGATATAGAWSGIAIDGGGRLTATYLEIHGADTAVAARPGSMYSIDHLVIDTSRTMLILSSNGTIAHGTLRGLGDSQGGPGIFVSNASPQISYTSVTGGLYQGVDMIIVGGAGSAPLFDHLEVADSHCAFHFDASSGAIISNSWLHHNTYGLMVIDSVNGQVSHNNFEDNAINIGSCAAGASAEVAANYFAGEPFGDGSCPTLAVTGVTPPAPYATGVGPMP